MVTRSTIIPATEIRSRMWPAWYVGDKTNCERPSATKDDTRSGEGSIINMGYSNTQPDVVSNRTSRISGDALGRQYTSQIANHSSPSHTRPIHSMPEILGDESTLKEKASQMSNSTPAPCPFVQDWWRTKKPEGTESVQSNGFALLDPSLRHASQVYSLFQKTALKVLILIDMALYPLHCQKWYLCPQHGSLTRWFHFDPQQKPDTAVSQWHHQGITTLTLELQF